MKIYVDLDHVDITEYTQIESGEYNTNKINFIFTPEYKDLVKVAIFGCKLDTDEPKFYKIYLSDDSCYLPLEVTTTSDVISIGVYAFNVENGELKLRYSPTPVKTIVYEGSFREEAENSSSPTPTEIEQIMSRIISLEEITSDLNTRVEALENKACDLDSIKEDVEQLKDDVEGISGRLDTAESDIDELEGDIANTYSKTEVDTLLGAKVDTTTFTASQNAQDEKINYADLIISQWPRTAYSEGNNISLTPTIEGKLDFDNLLYGDTSQDGTPTPDTPIDIQVVTGTQEVTISNADNTDTTSYTISLGNIELATIGMAKDYIYKSGDKWYKKEIIGKYTFTGQEVWGQSGATTSEYLCCYTNNLSGVDVGTITDTITNLYSNRFIGGAYTQTIGNIISSITNLYGFNVAVSKSIASDVNTFKTYLENNNTYVYYKHQITKNKEITDTTLIEELNSLYNAYSKYGTTNIQVEGTLAGGLKVRALKQLS